MLVGQRAVEVEIRSERPADAAGIRRVLEDAFGQPDEARIVEAIRERHDPVISLVALVGKKLVGHILFSPVTITSDDGHWRAAGLAPVAVLPDLQRQGNGQRLVTRGLEACRQEGHERVIVLGHPAYYPRFGFRPAEAFGISWEYEVRRDAFMALALTPGALDKCSGIARYLPEFTLAGEET